MFKWFKKWLNENLARVVKPAGAVFVQEEYKPQMAT